jgi:hypothetical protein
MVISTFTRNRRTESNHLNPIRAGASSSCPLFGFSPLARHLAIQVIPKPFTGANYSSAASSALVTSSSTTLPTPAFLTSLDLGGTDRSSPQLALSNETVDLNVVMNQIPDAGQTVRDRNM